MKVERLTGTQDEIMAQAVAVCYGKEPSVERVGRVVRHNGHIAVARFGWAELRIKRLTLDRIVSLQATVPFLSVKLSAKTARVGGNMQAWIDAISWWSTWNEKAANAISTALNAWSPQVFNAYVRNSPYTLFIEPIHDGEPYPAYRISGVSRSCAAQLARHTNIATCTRDDMPLSMLEQSTRYCDYGEAEFIAPENANPDSAYYAFAQRQKETYRALRNCGEPKQDARRILPLGTATTLCMAGRVQDWEAFIKLRDDKRAEWDIREVAQAIREDLGL